MKFPSAVFPASFTAPGQTPPRVYILLLNLNDWQNTITCLESLFRLEFPDFRVIVCDNQSTDDSWSKILAWANGTEIVRPASSLEKLHQFIFPPVPKPISCATIKWEQDQREPAPDPRTRLTLIQTGGNLGFSGGNNVGLHYIVQWNDFDYVWLLNNDTVVEPRALSELVIKAADNPKLGICGSTIYYFDAPDTLQCAGGNHYFKWLTLSGGIHQFARRDAPFPSIRQVEKKMAYVAGASMLVTREFLTQTGFLCPDYFLYFEELDWAWRAKGKFKLGYAPGSVLYHKEGGTTGTNELRKEKTFCSFFFSLRNRLLFSRKNCPETIPWVYLSLVLSFFQQLLLLRIERAILIMAFILEGILGLAWGDFFLQKVLPGLFPEIMRLRGLSEKAIRESPKQTAEKPVK